MVDRSGQLEVEVIEARGLTPKPGSKSLPGEAQQLTLAHSGKQGNGYPVLHGSALCRLQERGYLLIVERVNFFPFHPGQLTAVGGIARDVVQVNSLF